jgi:adenylyltransferase/sulfurtransferase
MREPDPPELIDVREPYEWQIARIQGARLVPLAELPRAMASLDGTREIVVYCHSGIRSDAAARHLRAAGFRATNLLGGINRWSLDVDPTVPRY